MAVQDDTGEEADQTEDDSVFVVSRRRIDCLFFFATIVAMVLSVTLALVFDDYKLLVSPLAILGLWLCIRFISPAEGITTRTITATPGAPQLLRWMALMVSVILGLMILDYNFLDRILDKRFHSYRLLPVPILFAVLLIGIARIEKRYRKNPPSPAPPLPTARKVES